MRNKLIDAMKKSCNNGRKVAVLNIGSGYDTFSFNANDIASDSELKTENIVYIELDLPTVIHKKLNIIKNNNEQLLNKLNSNKKMFQHLDMRVFDITKTESIMELTSIIEDQQVDDIIIYAECVFGYIQNEYIMVFLKKLRELVDRI